LKGQNEVVSVSERRYRFGPLERRALLGPLRGDQVAVLGVAALVGLVFVFATESVIGVLLALMLIGLAALSIFVPFQGRTAAEWIPVAVRFGLRKRGGDYRSNAPGVGFRMGGDEDREVSLPPELEGVELLSVPYGGEEVGVVCERREGTYTAAVAVRADAFALRDASEQARALELWGGVLASCARENSAVRRVQWIERAVPGQGDELAAYLQEKRVRTVPFSSKPVSSYIELTEAAVPVTQDHKGLVCVQIDTRRAGREMKRLGGGDEAACRILLREAEGVARRMGSAEIKVFGLLRPRQYAEVIRDAFDPFGHQARARSRLGDEGREGVEPEFMGPHAEEIGWSHYRSDAAFHNTYWISSWPRSEVGPSFLAPLLMQSATVRTVAVTIEPVPFGKAMRQAETAQSMELAGEMERRRQGFMTTASDRRRAQAVTRREEELVDGFAEMVFAGFVTVSAPSADKLERANGEVEHAGQQARLEFQRMYGEQEAAFTNTLPLCRGLR
jgi:hypothetical protein